MSQDDLKCEILYLKKQLHTIMSENAMLKVKSRKLENEIRKKNKHIESLLDPEKSIFIRKIISETGANIIINLKNRNINLEKLLSSKETEISKLQLNLHESKINLSNETPIYNKTEKNPKIHLENSTQNPIIQIDEYEQLIQNLRTIKLVNNDPKLFHNVIASPKLTKDDNPVGPNGLSEKQSSKPDCETHLTSILKEIDNLKQFLSQILSNQAPNSKTNSNRKRTKLK